MVGTIVDDPEDIRANQKQLDQLKSWVKPPALKEKNETSDQVNQRKRQILSRMNR